VVAFIGWRQPTFAQRAWPWLTLLIVVAPAPGIVHWVQEDRRALDLLGIEAGARRISGRDGVQHAFSKSVRASPGDVIEIQLRVRVLDKLPRKDASVRLAVAKAPVRVTETSKRRESLTYSTDRGVRADVLDRPGIFGNSTTVDIQPARSPIRIVPVGRSPRDVPLRVRTQQVPGPAPPWPRTHTVSASFGEDNESYITNLSGVDAVNKITDQYTDELIVFRVRIEAG
jgi:hypothetical protein